MNRTGPFLAFSLNSSLFSASGLPARGIALIKHLLNRSFDNDLPGQLEAEAFAQETAGLTADHVEGVVAFIEKRKPQFEGR